MIDDAPRERLVPGQVVAQGRFVLLEVLGRGGLATVFRARDTRGGTEVALKVLCDRYVGRPEREERLRREFEYAARVDHPSVIEVYERGTLEDGRPFFSMELVLGQPLSHVLSGSGGLPYPRMRRLARALAVALDAVHQAGIVHRDVKPANVLVLEGDRIKLVDFGMAGDSDAPAVPAGHTARLTRVNDLLGTHEYMAPEQVLKQAPRRSMDVFALGVVMYELLSSITPYSGMGVREYVELQIAGDPLLRSAARWGRIRQAPEGLAVLIDDCRQRDPQRRPADMQEVIRRLDALDRALVLSPSGAVSSMPTEVSPSEAAFAPSESGVVPVTPASASVEVPARTPGVPAGPVVMMTHRDPTAPLGAAAGERSRGRWRPMAWVALPSAAAVLLSLGWFGARGSAPEPGDITTSTSGAIEGASPEDTVQVGTPQDVLSRTAEPTTQTLPQPWEGEQVDTDGQPAQAATDTGTTAGEHDELPSAGRAPEAPRANPPAQDGPSKRRARPRPTAPTPVETEPEHPPTPGSRPAVDECAPAIARARAAFASYRWPAVLAHTRDASCWAEHEAEYLMMRTEALMEEERWSECVRTGRRSSDPGVRRHAERCQKRLDTLTETP